MSDQFTTTVNGDAPVHAGVGDLIVNLFAEYRRTSLRQQGEDHLAWLRRHFVEPPGFGRADGVLAEHGTVVLAGHSGSGRITAALMLLDRSRRPGQALYEVEMENETLDADQVGEGDLLVLDLSGQSGEELAKRLREVAAFRAGVRARGCRLVVVVGSGNDARIKAEHGRYQVDVGRPAGREVFWRHLRVAGVLDVDSASLPEQLTTYLDRNSMGEVAAFAQTVLALREGGGDLAKWCERAYRARTGLIADHAEQLSEVGGGLQRSMLLATAMLHGSPVELVYQAALALLRVTEHPPASAPMLERPDLLRLLKDIRAKVDGADGVRFEDVERDQVVRVFFWRYVPGLRDLLPEWISGVIKLVERPDARDALVQRFADQCLDGHPDMLISAALAWIERPATAVKLRAVAVMLRCGIEHSEHGGLFRRRIFEWSKSTELSAEFTSLLAYLCADVMATRHPNEALVRLHHLARRERADAVARSQLLRLVKEIPRLHRLLLSRLDRTFTLEVPRYLTADMVIFALLIDPVVLTETGLADDDVIRGQLAQGWSALFGRSAAELWKPRLDDWLGTIASRPVYREALLDTLLTGAKGRISAVSAVYASARRTGAAPDLLVLIRRKIALAQSLS